MKKILIVIIALAVAAGGLLVYKVSSAEGDLVEESAIDSFEVEDNTYYEADYVNGNSATSVKDLTFTLPEMFTGIESDDDSVNQNLYIDKDTGVKLSINEQHSRSSSEYEKDAQEYLESASDIEKFKVSGYTAYKFTYKEGKSAVECDFIILAGDSFYSGYMYHEGKVDDIQEDEPEAIPLSDDMIREFDKLCSSLAFK